MKIKNRNHEYKRAISERKFSRLFDANLDKAGFAYVTKNWETERSLAAVMVDNIIYARFATKDRSKNSLDTFCIRYKIEDGYAEDFVAFSPFPLKLF